MTPLLDDVPAPVIPDDESGVLRLLGILLLQHGMPSRAAICFDVLCELSADDEQLQLSRACALLRAGDATGAINVLERLFPTPSDPALAWLLRGQALTQLGRPLEAARAMRMFIRHRQTPAEWS